LLEGAGIVRLFAVLFFFDDACREDRSVAVVVELNGQDQHVPHPVGTLGGKVGRAAEAATVDVGLARIGNRA